MSKGYFIMKFKINRSLLLFWVVFLLILLLECSVKWVDRQFGRVNFDEILLVLQIGRSGTDVGLLWSFINKVILRSFGWSVILTAVCHVFKKYKHVPVIICTGLFMLLAFRLCTSNVQMGSFMPSNYSSFYESHYVAPETAKITWSDKRNVLLIVLESMEKTYANQELFGTDGLTPNITNLEQKYVSFERYQVLSGLTHTIAAITGMVTGLPLFFSSYRNVEKMLGTSGIGSLFVNNGYQTWSMFPASGKFSLKENFLRRMGFENIYDGERFRTMLDHELEEYPFDGVDDANLFKISKPMIAKIVKSDKPYFILMETINTHLKGYYTKACRDMGFPQKNMEDIAKCEDKIIYDFVQWFRKQDPSAVVILINDHEQHAGSIMKKLETVQQRSLNNVFINTDAFNGVDLNRPVSAMDFFPTVVEVAGGKIQGCRLGLGTSLTRRCAMTKTLREQYGDEELEKLMEQKNKLYYKLSVGGE